jgi:hypothetical protein
MPDTSAPLSVRDLRRRWKPHKESLQAAQAHHPTAVRLHRAFSWLARVEQIPDDGADHDVVLICRWIAFNALYGRWDPTRREPAPGQSAWRDFLKRILSLDAGSMLAQVLQTHKPLVLSILEDEYLSDIFWEEPSPSRAGKARKAKYDARTWYIEGRWGLILDHLVNRIYLLRCQLTHGAATYGGSLNRRSLKHCATMLGHVMPAVILVVIDHGRDEDWGPMCYPPMRPLSVRQGTI